MNSLRPMVSKYTNYREYLKDYYLFKRFSNRGWTFSKWAAETGVGSASLLNMIVNGRRFPSRDLVNKLVVGLELNEEEAKRFRVLVGIGKTEPGATAFLEELSAPSANTSAVFRITFDVDKNRLVDNQLDQVMAEIKAELISRISNKG